MLHSASTSAGPSGVGPGVIVGSQGRELGGKASCVLEEKEGKLGPSDSLSLTLPHLTTVNLEC